MTEEDHVGVSDHVYAELIDCSPPEPEPVTVPIPPKPEVSPEQTKRDATIEQTGADPPPR